MNDFREYGYGTHFYVSYPFSVYRKARAMCSDGKTRVTSWVALTADTSFSIPAHIKIKGKTVSGYLTIETAEGHSTATAFDPEVVKFVANQYGHNASVVPRGAWKREGPFSETEKSALIEKAEKLGEALGSNAASWVFGGNTSRETYQAYHEGIQNGDPAIMDDLPHLIRDGDDNSEGSYNWLAAELELDSDMPGYAQAMEEFWASYEMQFSVTVEFEVERMCLYQLKD